MRKTPGAILILMLLGLGSLSCSTVPKEVVELSYRVGQDMESVHISYRMLVKRHFESLRQDRQDYLDHEWTPAYLRDWIEEGRLRDVVKGDVIWSEEKEDFVEPSPAGKEAELLETVGFWAQAAIEDIEGKRIELMKPLDEQEAELSTQIEDAFQQLLRGNATITAHLNSLRKVQEVQDDALAALKLKDLRDKVNDTLVKASSAAAMGLESVRKADGLVDTVGSTITKVKKQRPSGQGE